jgi:hypothetical protein
MPRSNWRFKNNIPKLRSALRAELEKVVTDTVESGRDRTEREAPSPTNPGPYASGATRRGLYVVTEAGSDYNERVDEAKKAPGARLQGMILDKVELKPSRPGDFHGLWAAPFQYDEWIHEGFFSVTANRYVAPNPFMLRARNEEESYFIKRLVKALKRLEKIR